MSAIEMDGAEIRGAEDPTRKAQENTLLSPRFYTTDFDGFDRMDMAPIRAQFDSLMAEFEADVNRTHFERDADFDAALADCPEMSPELREEFIDLLVSSVTAEFSGCVLYTDIKKRVKNPDVQKLMAYMARDESRHANFINQSLKDFDLGVDLGFLTKAKKYHYFSPKFILYATYLSEKIGYARYITIYRQLERHPERQFHPIFRYFKEWCNDEFRHGEAFALMMRAKPRLLRGHNKLWIKFFVLAVFATMYVRDHTRPALHHAFGFDPTEYDRKVLHICSEITKQVFPLTLDMDNPAFWSGLARLARIGAARDRAKERGGITGTVQRGALAFWGAATFARLYMLPAQKNRLPEDARLAPAW